MTRFLAGANGGFCVTGLDAGPVSEGDIPNDIRATWIAPDGRPRLQVTPRASVRGSAALLGFVNQVQSVAPQAAGSAVTIVRSAQTVVNAFRSAAINALVAITLILIVVLRRARGCGLLVLTPLIVSSLLVVLVGCADASTAEFCQHHCPAPASWRGRVVQHLSCHGLARGQAAPPGVGHCTRGGIFSADDRHRVRVAGAVASSRNGQHGGFAAGQPGVHGGHRRWCFCRRCCTKAARQSSKAVLF